MEANAQLYSPHLPPGAQVAPPAKRELFGKKKSVLTEGREDGVCVCDLHTLYGYYKQKEPSLV